jgi:hypothetical protein
MKWLSALSIVPLNDDCQVTVEPSGDPEVDRRSWDLANKICGNLTTDHPSADYRWSQH